MVIRGGWGQKDKVLKEKMCVAVEQKECQRLNRGKYWQSDRLCKVFRPYCLRCLCFSQYGVLSFKIRLLCVSRATVRPPGPHNSERQCVPNLESSGLVAFKCGLLCFFSLCVWIRKRELGLIEVCFVLCVCVCVSSASEEAFPILSGRDRQVLIQFKSSSFFQLNSWLSCLFWQSLLRQPSFIYAQNKDAAWCCFLADFSHQHSSHRCSFSLKVLHEERFEERLERFVIVQILLCSVKSGVQQYWSLY